MALNESGVPEVSGRGTEKPTQKNTGNLIKSTTDEIIFIMTKKHRQGNNASVTSRRNADIKALWKRSMTGIDLKDFSDKEINEFIKLFQDTLDDASFGQSYLKKDGTMEKKEADTSSGISLTKDDVEELRRLREKYLPFGNKKNESNIKSKKEYYGRLLDLTRSLKQPIEMMEDSQGKSFILLSPEEVTAYKEIFASGYAPIEIRRSITNGSERLRNFYYDIYDVSTGGELLVPTPLGVKMAEEYAESKKVDEERQRQREEGLKDFLRNHSQYNFKN